MVNWKRTTFKQRLIRLLDRWSNWLRPKFKPPVLVRNANDLEVEIGQGTHLVTVDQVKPRTLLNGLQVTDISLVTHCPYCGTDDWDTPKTKPDGSVCDHPTKLRVVK